MRIFFIGYMGAGKSHTAKQLEEVTGRKCIDLDVAIEEQMGLSIEAAFSQRGEVFFRNQEALVLDKVLSDSTIEIVACGGGASCARCLFTTLIGNPIGACCYTQLPILDLPTP